MYLQKKLMGQNNPLTQFSCTSVRQRPRETVIFARSFVKDYV